MEKHVLIKSGNYEESETDILFLELGKDHYNFAIADSALSNLKAIGSDDSLASKIPLLQRKFKNVLVSAFTPSFSLVPFDFIGNKSSFSNLMNIDAENTSLYEEVLINQQIVNLFNIPDTDKENLDRHFPAHQLCSQVQPFVKGNIKNDGIYINIRNTCFELLIVENQSILFYNVFEFKNDNELQYFLLLVLQQKGIDAASALLKISGDIHESSLTFQRLRMLIPNLSINEASKLITYDNSFIEMHRYFSLLSLTKCVL
ncbi:DUF3822 family protein [Pseudopedobacter beijingensis]|uniref:DUF3822 family protein n=1 Tax=Pseudopedobacter beijingensis TaxID=1207056 RepID=A0ABW4IFH7_9SPHI